MADESPPGAERFKPLGPDGSFLTLWHRFLAGAILGPLAASGHGEVDSRPPMRRLCH